MSDRPYYTARHVVSSRDNHNVLVQHSLNGLFSEGYAVESVSHSYCEVDMYSTLIIARLDYQPPRAA